MSTDDIEELRVRHAYLHDMMVRGGEKIRRIEAVMTVTADGEVGAAYLVGDVDDTDFDREMKKRGTARAARDATAREAVEDIKTTIQNCASEADQIAKQIQRAVEAERAALKARLQAKATEVVKAYRATFDVAVAHLAELHALADALAPHCKHSQGNCLNNETYLRPRHIDLPGGVNGVEVGTLVVTADQITAARARLFPKGI
jgi:hypothetical protein